MVSSQGRVGVVAGLEVSRLARDNADWAYLVKICRLTDTLLLDQYALYDPKDPNDRMLLSMKGNLSETELTLIHARCQGAILSLARRGEYHLRLPVGFVYDPEGHVVLDPDEEVQGAIRHFFETFRRMESAESTARVFWEEGLRVPVRIEGGLHKGEVEWKEVTYGRVMKMLHNPRYAGTYSYGRTIERRKMDGTSRQVNLPREKWVSCIPSAHPGYITWEEFERNQSVLRENCPGGNENFRSTAREGPALLQGIVLCGVCGRGMGVRYGNRKGNRNIPIYVCRGERIAREKPLCQRMNGERIDEAIGNLLVEAVTPMVVDEAMKVQRELEAREGEAARLRRQAVDRAQHEADTAHLRYLKVDPTNRLVVASLERTWNEKLQILARVQTEWEVSQDGRGVAVNRAQQLALRTLKENFADLWQDPRIPCRERKRLVRMILEDVTLFKGQEDITVNVRFKGGANRTLTVRRAPRLCDYATKPEVVHMVQGYCSPS